MRQFQGMPRMFDEKIINQKGTFFLFLNRNIAYHAHRWAASADPEGGTGGPDPPGKSQVIWVSIGNKQLDPPWKKFDPPGTLKNDRFQNY